MTYVSVNKREIISAVSARPFSVPDGNTLQIDDKNLQDAKQLIGKKIIKKDNNKLKIALICNWNQECGISTYTNYLVKALKPKCHDLRIFSEIGCPPEENVIPCWERGKSMVHAMDLIDDYNPDFVLIQHEFGIFPRAPYLLQMLQRLHDIPYAVVLHSTYEHLDKSICTSAMKNIIVHSNKAKDVLRRLGNSSDIQVIPHGCVEFPDRKELWNIFQTPYAIVQFGFGFFYKGVDRAIDAVAILKRDYPDKYDSESNKIFYCYLCSENSNTKNIHSEYLGFLSKKIREENLEDNVVIVRKYHTEQEINNYLRTAKLAIFPYLINENNVVYGASGAIRVAMANGIPVLASESHLFDEIPGLPRPSNAAELAVEIDKIFSDWKYKDKLIKQQDDFVKENTWDKVSSKYMEVMDKIRMESAILI